MMAEQKFIRIVNWDRFQHYKNRNPPWIKLHRELLTSRTWATLDDASRVLAIALMMLAAATGNKIPLDPTYIRRVAYLNQDPDLSGLLATEFIEIVDNSGCASASLADASKPHTNARPEKEAEKETEVERECGANAPPPAPPSARKSRSTQMPAGFRPNAGHQTLAQELGVDLETAFAAFTDHHLAKGSVFKDWDRAFNTWLRREPKFAPKGATGHENRAQQRQDENCAAASGALEILGRRRMAG